MNKLLQKVAKIFLGLCMAAGVGVAIGSGRKDASPAHAAEITVDGSTISGWNTTQGSQSGSKDGITISSDNAAKNNSQLRFYSGGTHTFTSSVGNITSAVFTCTASGTSNYGPGKMSGDGYSYSGKTGTWSGNAASFTLTGGQSRCTSIVFTVTSGGGTDPVAVTGVSLNKNSTSIKVGATETLTATVSPNDATDKSVTWKSYSDSACTTESSAVASVSSTGEVTGVSEGTAYIQVKTTDGNFTAKCTVTVTPPTDTYNLGGKTWFIKAGSYIANTITDSSSHAPATSEKSSAQAFEFILVGDNQFNIKAVGGDYDGKYLYSTSSTGSSNKCYLNTTIQKWTVVTNSTNINLKDANNNYLCCYSSSDFRAYGNLNNGNPNFTFESASFTVTYDGNTNSSGTVPTDSTSYASGATVTVKGNTGNLAKTGYSFGGWNTNAQGTGTSYDVGATFSISGDTTLYAKWTANSYNINYYDQGGSAFTGTHASGYPTSHTYGTTTTLKSASKTGYIFGGWFTTSACTGSAVTSLGATAYTAAIDLYAKWTIEQYSVSASITNGGFTGTTGANAATFGVEYTATITANANYALPVSLTVTMGGAATNAYSYNSSTGEFSIASPTGNISISGVCTPNSTEYLISTTVNDGSYSGDTSIYSGFTASITFTPNDHYKLPADSSAFTVYHAEIQSYNSSTGVLVLENPDDDVTVSVSMVAKSRYDVTLALTNITKSSGPSGTDAVEEGEEVTIVFVANSNYGLPSTITVVMGETTLVVNQDYTWTQNSGTLHLSGLTADLSVSVSGVQRDLTNGNLTLGSKKTSYTLGDDYELPSTVTANFNIAPLTVDVKNDVVVSGPVENGVVTGSGTITLTYTYVTTGNTQTASYTITTNSISPSDGGIAKVTSTSDLTVGSTVYLVCEGRSKQMSAISTTSTKYGEGTDYSTTPSNVYPLTVCAGYGGSNYAFKNSSDKYLYWVSGNSLNQDSSLSNNTSWTVSFDDDGNATILNVADSSREIMWNCSSPRFACYAGQTPTYDVATGYNMVQLYKNYPPVVKSLKWITAEVKSGTYYQGNAVTASDFIVTAHYDDGSTSTPTSDITLTNATLTVIGKNTVTLTYGGKSCNVDVTAVEQTAEYTGLSWAQGEYTIIDGQAIDFSKFGTVTAEYDDGDSYATKSIEACSVATYTKSGDVYTKVNDLDNGDTITSTSHGKYLGVTYTDTNTFVAYSSAPIYVVEEINDVYTQVPTTTWSKVTSLNVGDKITFVNETANKVASGKDGNVIVVSSYESSVSTDFYFTVGKVGDYYTFYNTNGYLGCHSSGTSGDNYAYFDADIDDENNYNYFTVSFSEGNVVITSVYNSSRTLQFNSTRFCFYGSNQSPVQLYKGTDGYSPSGESFANTNAVVQKAVLQFAVHFNDTMQCVNGGSTANVSTKWSTLSSDFSTALSGFTGDNLTHFKALFAYAYSVEGGDTLQDMLARYDYIVAKYKLADFLNTAADRPEVAQSPHISPLINIIGEKTNTVALIVIISMVSVTAIGGYFFLRKRKENI